MFKKIVYVLESLRININRVSKKYKINKISIFLDMLLCMIKYSASPSNYYYFGFAKLNKSQRNTYVTHRVSEKIQKKYNSNKYHIIFYDKVIFSKVFSEYYGRKSLATFNMNFSSFKDFVNYTSKFIYKPLEGGQGNGIKVYEKINLSDSFLELKNKKGIIEEWIEQPYSMMELYPNSVNIVRIQTIFSNNECHFLGATLTVGYKNNIANASTNSIFCLVDINTGQVYTDGCDYSGNLYVFHPETSKKFNGFQIPLWKEIIEMLKKAACIVPQVGYVGWDVAITDTRPIIIEGNNDGGYVGYQLAELSNGQGKKDLYQKYL